MGVILQVSLKWKDRDFPSSISCLTIFKSASVYYLQSLPLKVHVKIKGEQLSAEIAIFITWLMNLFSNTVWIEEVKAVNIIYVEW